jgi:hypothetical protein
MAGFFTKVRLKFISYLICNIQQAVAKISTVNNPEGIAVLSNRPLNDWIKNDKLCVLCVSVVNKFLGVVIDWILSMPKHPPDKLRHRYHGYCM